MNTDERDYQDGLADGYSGMAMNLSRSEAYDLGYHVGTAQRDEEMAAEREREAEEEFLYDTYGDMYDYDPSPYNGDYSEM